jgi:membrane protease YdiL (CAAX protease family)
VERFSPFEPLLVLLIVGVGFSALAWLFTRRASPLPVEIRRPGGEVLLLVAYLATVGAFLAWGFNVVESTVTAGPLRSGVLLGTKLVVFVLIPGLLFGQLWGYRIHHFLPPSTEWRRYRNPALWMALVMILFQAVFGRGLSEIRHSGLPAWALLVGIPLAGGWLLIEAGLVEEFFFRALLQSRLSAWLQSEVGGVVLASLLFGLAHAPGLYYRTGKTLEAVGPNPSWLMAVGYSIVIISVAGFFLGVLWTRTRNLPLLVVVHAAADLVPNLAQITKNSF